jgi:hypothetical protein
MLTTNEKLLIADALNGCYIPLEHDAAYLRRTVGDEGARRAARFEGLDAEQRIKLTGVVCCGLEHEVYDAIELDDLAAKWRVDGPALLNKIAAMTPRDRTLLLRRVAEVWQRNDSNFVRDLEALEV